MFFDSARFGCHRTHGWRAAGAADTLPGGCLAHAAWEHVRVHLTALLARPAPLHRDGAALGSPADVLALPGEQEGVPRERD